jgi:hypothetical protein
MAHGAVWGAWLFLLAASTAAADLAELKAKGVLLVIAQKDEAPELFNFAEGEPGFEREVIAGFARLHDLAVKPVTVPTAADRLPATPAAAT